MNEWKTYKRKGQIEAVPWVPGFDMTDVSVSYADAAAGSPLPGDMIARNPENHDDRWLVARAFFERSYEG